MTIHIPQWLLWGVGTVAGETIEICDSEASKNAFKLLWPYYLPECRVARVQITELEEGEDDKG